MPLVKWLASGLNLTPGYRLFSEFVGARHARQVFVNEYLQPRKGEKVLDIGCGPGDLLDFLPEVDYLGLDVSAEYIAAAKRRFGSRARFMCGDVGLAAIERELGTFQLVMSVGVLHHLDDQRANQLFNLAARVLVKDGRLVTYDGCYTSDQSLVAKWMLSNDRGRFVRTREAYEKFASAHFSKIESYLRCDLLRVPYTHLIMRCLR